MSEGIVIEEYTSAYQAQVVDLILPIQQDEYGIAITKADQPDLFHVEEFYQRGNGNFWVARHGDRVVGTIALVDIGNQQVALRKMFVAEAYRSGTFGTARLLLNGAIAWAQQKGVREIWLGTTPQFVAAHRFYEKNGFQEVAMGDLPANFPVMQVDKKFYKYAV